MLKKIFFIFLFILINNSYSNTFYKIIATVGNKSITEIDLINEIKILNLLNNGKYSNVSKEYILSNLIEEKLKDKEIQNEKIKIDEEIINKYLNKLFTNLDINKNQIENNYLKLIKDKIIINASWDLLISKKFGWKININMQEIDNKLSKLKKDEKVNSIELKEKLIKEEKNKKLDVFSKYYLKKIKNQTLIQIIK